MASGPYIYQFMWEDLKNILLDFPIDNEHVLAEMHYLEEGYGIEEK